jgi:hypothetical protein
LIGPDLRHIKQAYKPFTRFQMDVKHLYDIPHYWPQMKTLALPPYQFTIRELSCGAHFVCYASELTKAYATVAICRFLNHLQYFAINITEVVIQTDLGNEFDGNTIHYRTGGFHSSIQDFPFNATHKFNPPKQPNYNADVETVHNTIELEFFDIENFSSLSDFFNKVSTYQNWYNLRRINFSRGQSPLQALYSKAPLIRPKIFLLDPINLDHYLLSQGGYDVPKLSALYFRLSLGYYN